MFEFRELLPERTPEASDHVCMLLAALLLYCSKAGLASHRFASASAVRTGRGCPTSRVAAGTAGDRAVSSSARTKTGPEWGDGPSGLAGRVLDRGFVEVRRTGLPFGTTAATEPDVETVEESTTRSVRRLRGEAGACLCREDERFCFAAGIGQSVERMSRALCKRSTCSFSRAKM